MMKSMQIRINILKRRELDAEIFEMSKDTDYQRRRSINGGRI